MRVETAQLPPIDDSDDKIFITDNAVIMLDGASAFVPVQIPANTYADRLGRELRDLLTENDEADLTGILADAIRTTATAFDLRPGESPSSTVTILRRRGDQLDIFVLGDNLVVLPDETLTDERMDELDLAPRRRYRERLAGGGGYDDEHKALLTELQTQQATYRNVEGGYWIAEADPTAAAQALVWTRPVATVPWAVLATDGAYNTMQHIGGADWSQLTTAGADDLADLLDRCQIWEAEDDPTGKQLPRAKRHDDKSIATVTFED